MLDGMILIDYPGPKGQLILKNGESHFFCDTKGLVETLYNPDYKAKIRSAFVQDFAGREWGSYSDHWIDINQAFLVLDSGRFGAMGPTIASFSAREAADAFASQHGGKVLTIGELNEAEFEAYLKRVRQQLREAIGGATISGEVGLTPEHQHSSGHSHD